MNDFDKDHRYIVPDGVVLGQLASHRVNMLFFPFSSAKIFFILIFFLGRTADAAGEAFPCRVPGIHRATRV